MFSIVLRCFWYSLLFAIWGLGMGFVVNGSAVFNFLETGWPWVLSAFTVLWICLSLLARPARRVRNADFKTLTDSKDKEWKGRQERIVPAWIEEFAEKQKPKP